jgi:tetratricopeptide (TPR) repeat protein
MYLGYVTMNIGDHDGARKCFVEMLEAGRLVEDARIMSRALGCLGLLELELTNFESSKAYFEEALTLTEREQNPDASSMIISNLGVLALKLEDYELAEHYMSRALASAREAKNKINIMIGLINLGEVAHYRHDYRRAVKHYLEGFPILQEIGDKVSIVSTLEMFAFLIIDHGYTETGLSLLGTAEAQRELLNAPIIPREQVRYDQYLAIAGSRLDEEAVQAARKAGRSVSLDEAVAVALTHLQRVNG